MLTDPNKFQKHKEMVSLVASLTLQRDPGRKSQMYQTQAAVVNRLLEDEQMRKEKIAKL
jgi:hypothetical protein